MSLICAARVCCLSNYESLAMVTNLLGKEDVDKDFEQLILEKTEGVPFFIEEFLKSMEPHGQARGLQEPYPPTPRLRRLIRREAKSAEAK